MKKIRHLIKNPIFKTILKFGFVFVLLFYLTKKGFLSIDQTKHALKQWQYILPAFLAMIFTTLITILRWYILLSAQGIQLNWTRVLQLQFVGNFFNIALPGAVSGDVVKAIYVAREIHGKRAQAFSSILFDRVAGVSGLILLSLLGVFFNLMTGWKVKLPDSVQWFVILTGLGILAFYVYLFLMREKKDPLLKIFKKMETRIQALGSVTRIYEGIRTYHSKKGAVFYSLLISCIVHTVVIFAIVNICWAVQVHDLSLLGIMVLVPIGLLVTAIPVTPAGLGTGHAAFLGLLHLLGTDRGADIFTIFIFYKFIEGTVGGLVYLRFKSQQPIKLETESLA